ncbi:BrnT family toxin [Azomonas macrocytogenes]|uniref:BrnT family toxin n=1 Tax=Azomonas macrocytogenes TaxID=69962 RepID=UPI0030845EE0
MHTIKITKYEFDPAKSATNLEKHGVSFDAVEDFEWENAMVEEDNRNSYGEKRYIAYGPIRDRLYVLVFTPRADRFRIISLRKANRREQLKRGKP